MKKIGFSGILRRRPVRLRTTLSVSYLLVALLSILLTTVLARVIVENRFQTYVKQVQARNDAEILSFVTGAYSNGTWEDALLDLMSRAALQNGVVVKVLDPSGTAVWDASVRYGDLYSQTIGDLLSGLKRSYPTIRPRYAERQYSIIAGGRDVGTLIVGYYSPIHMNDVELSFINRLNLLFIFSGIATLGFALLMGIVSANRIAAPLTRVIRRTGLISNGFYKERLVEKTSSAEIGELSDSINDLAASLDRQQEIRKQMTSDIAHELRTPLSTLQGHLEAMIDGVWEPDVERIKVCHEEILRINRMVGDLEKLERYEDERLVLDRSAFDLADEVRKVAANFESSFLSKKIRIYLKLQPARILADRDKVRQILVNLLSNALKYTARGGTVWVETARSAKDAVLTVRDDGIGIPPQDLPYIFERLYRADKSRSSSTGGAGIGLSITKAIVDAHKGSVDAKSELGKGSTFTVRLPLGDGESS